MIKKLLLSLMLVSSLASCTKKEDANLKIGLYGPFSGGTASLGEPMRNGYQMAVEEINSGGGIMGKKVELIIRDDESKNEKGTQIIKEFLDKEKVVAVLGPINTGVADASTQYSNMRKVPHIISASAGAKVNDHFTEFPENYIFRFAAGDSLLSKIIVREAVENLKATKIAILCDDTNFGQAGRKRLEEHLKSMGMTAVYEGKFRLKDTDMTAQLQQAKAAGAQVLLTYGVGPELAAVSNSLNRLGWKVPMVSTWTVSMGSYIQNAGDNSEGVSMPMTFIESSEHTPRAKKFLETYWAKFNEKPIRSAIAAVQSYDAMYLLKQAIEQAKSTDGPKIKAALENLEKPFEGVTGTYKKPYSTTDHEAMHEDHVQVGVIKSKVVVPKYVTRTQP